MYIQEQEIKSVIEADVGQCPDDSRAITKRQLRFLVDTVGLDKSVVSQWTNVKARSAIDCWLSDPPATARQIEYLKLLGASDAQLDEIRRDDASALIAALKEIA